MLDKCDIYIYTQNNMYNNEQFHQFDNKTEDIYKLTQLSQFIQD